jgi:glycosyltransferase involved in cell wall biosynthesis
MASACEISIIIPVFNEASKLLELLNNIRALQLASSEIIVIDDGSTDGSADTAMAGGANVIRHPYNIGNGAAIKSGIRAARGRLLVLMDGDGQHRPEDIPRLTWSSARGPRDPSGGFIAMPPIPFIIFWLLT